MNTVNPEKKRVLLINPCKEGPFRVKRAHIGLGILAAALHEHGHSIKVVDYSFLHGINLRPPALAEIVEAYAPDVVGISAFTYLYSEVLATIDAIARCTRAPLILGGPHVTMFPDDFARDTRISYLVTGEAEAVLPGLVAEASMQTIPRRIDGGAVPAEKIPVARLADFMGIEKMEEYQIQLSRGCPYNCSFCTICKVAGRHPRARDLDVCLDEICRAKETHPHIRQVTVTDDCPAFNPARFKEFMRRLAARRFNCKLTVANIRARDIDEEFVALYKAAGGAEVCIGVESGDPEVFALIDKGETLDDIRTAAALIRRGGLALGMCFVIGLPGDNPLRHRTSVAFAKAVGPDYVFWNMYIAWPGTRAWEWYSQHGRIGDIRGFSTLLDEEVRYARPPVDSPEFTAEDRIRAWLYANLETYNIPLRLPTLARLAKDVWRFRLTRSFCACIVGKAGRVLRRRWRRWHKPGLPSLGPP